MNFDPAAAEPPAPESRRATLLANLDAHLRAVLTEVLGEAYRTQEEPGAETPSYRFVFQDAVCIAEITPYNDQHAVLSFLGELGRVYRGYAQAFRWFAANRRCNTTAIADLGRAQFSLWISANRNTLLDDAAGIRIELLDFLEELRHAVTGLRFWFPQFFCADAVHRWQSGPDANEMMASAMEHPRALLRAVREDEAPVFENPFLFAYVTRWMGAWDLNLRLLRSAEFAALADEVPGLREILPASEIRALRALRRYEEILDDALPRIGSALPPDLRAAVEAECHFRLGRDEDALETIRSADCDGVALTHFVRAAACSRLGRLEEAAGHFHAYTAMVGTDLLAERELEPLIAPHLE